MDKAELLTPLKHLQRRQRAAKIFGALLTVGMVLLVCFVLAVNDGRNYRRLVNKLGVENPVIVYLHDYLPDYLTRPFATAAPQAIKSRRIGRTPRIPMRLTDANVPETERLQRQPRMSAYERCERLAADGGAAPTFQAAGGEWECLFSRELGSDAEPSVLFIQIKGVSSSEFRTFRLKLNRLDPSQNAEMVRLALLSIDAFGLEMSPQSHKYMEDRIRSGDVFSSRLENYRVSLDQERDDSRRLNIIITQRPSSTGCTEGSLFGSDGTRMHASTALVPIGCFPLPSSSSTIQPD